LGVSFSIQRAGEEDEDVDGIKGGYHDAEGPRKLTSTRAAFVTAPGLMYVLIERFIFRGNVAVMGAR